MKRPEIDFDVLTSVLEAPVGGVWDQLASKKLQQQVIEQLEIQIKYQGYIDRQQQDVAKMQRQETTVIPMGFNFSQVSGLSYEVQQKLLQQQPATLGQASRIPGVTPAAMSLLGVYLKKHRDLTVADSGGVVRQC